MSFGWEKLLTTNVYLDLIFMLSGAKSGMKAS